MHLNTLVSDSSRAIINTPCISVKYGASLPNKYIPSYRLGMDIGLKIKGARKLRKMTQPELARRCGWFSEDGETPAQGRISHYELNRRPISMADADTIAVALGMSLVQMLSIGEPVADAAAKPQMIDSEFYLVDDDERKLIRMFRQLDKEGGGRLRVQGALADEVRKEKPPPAGGDAQRNGQKR